MGTDLEESKSWRPSLDDLYGPSTWSISMVKSLSTSSGLGWWVYLETPWAGARPSVDAQAVAAAAGAVVVVAADKPGSRSCSGSRGCPGPRGPLRCPCSVPSELCSAWRLTG